MTDQVDTLDTVSTLSVPEAAAYYGVSEKTIRRRITAGTLKAQKVATATGAAWRVEMDRVDTMSSPRVQGGQNGQPMSSPDLVRLIEKLHAENTQLAGQLGFVQARLQEAEKTIALLMAPKDEPAPAEVPGATPARPWWKVWKR